MVVQILCMIMMMCSLLDPHASSHTCMLDYVGNQTQQQQPAGCGGLENSNNFEFLKFANFDFWNFEFLIF